jgi:FeS assembly SUF system protein
MNSAVVQFKRPHEELAMAADCPEDATVEEKIVAQLRAIYDPELPVNIYDLGLIYKIDVNGRDADVVMTLTSPNCPVAGSMPAQVECAIKALDEVDNVCVELTWDPPWDSANLSDEVKLTLGLL